MRTVLKKIVTHTYKPVLEKYLSKTRSYEFEGLKLKIPPQVFHPGFFTSTHLLLHYLRRLGIRNRSLLELGAGSGLIGLIAAREGAIVTASDINPIAVEWLKTNSDKNNIELEIVESDLFENIPAREFDIIAINPPYYKKDPATLTEYAWYCGNNGEYFYRLFQQLPAYMGKDSIVIMVLCDGCDLEMIRDAAHKGGFEMELKQSRQKLIEKHFIYQFHRK